MYKRVVWSILFLLVLILPDISYAGNGGSAGISPGTGLKMRIENGGVAIYIPIRFLGEMNFGDEGQHGVGGTFSFDIKTGGNFFSSSIIAFTPEYKYYLNPRGSSPYFGAYTDFRFKSGNNIIGVGGLLGYQYMFKENLGFYCEANGGYANSNINLGMKRTHGGEFGAEVGFKYQFGGN